MLFRRRTHSANKRRPVRSDPRAIALSGGQAGQWGWGGDAAALHPQRWSTSYGRAEFLDEQPHLTDLVPRRLVAFAVLLGLGAGAIVGLAALHGCACPSGHSTGGERLAAFDLVVRGSLGTWFASMLLAGAALTSLLVYHVRRFKVDDCRGHYRVWLWAAACWLLMSIDTTAGLHHAFAVAMVSLTGARLLGDGTIWWVVAYGFLLGGIGTRLLVDMRSCWLSAAALILALGCFAAAVTGQFGWVEVPDGVDPRIAIRAAVLAGNLLLLLGVGLHARHVILDAHGLLPQKAESEEDEEEDERRGRGRVTSLGGETSFTVHPPQGIPAPNAPIYSPSSPLNTAALFHPVDFAPVPAVPPSAASGWPNGPVRRKLTKQEKKVLRERLERMRREREARAG